MARGSGACQGDSCGRQEGGGGSGTSRPEATFGGVVTPPGRAGRQQMRKSSGQAHTPLCRRCLETPVGDGWPQDEVGGMFAPHALTQA